VLHTSSGYYEDVIILTMELTIKDVTEAAAHGGLTRHLPHPRQTGEYTIAVAIRRDEGCTLTNNQNKRRKT
jgi:hypothetical protein